MKSWKKFVFGEFRWKQLLKSLVSIYVMLLIFVVCFGDYLIFVPPAPTYSLDQPRLELIDSENDGESIATLYYPAAEGMPTLLWSHGNAEDLGTAANLFEVFHDRGFGLFAYEYPGYGLSNGKASDHSCYAAVRKAYQHLTSKLNVDTNKILIVGQSVGSGPATFIASEKPAAGLVLISPFTSIYRVPFKYPIFPRDRFPNLSRIKKIKKPLMVIHGDLDTTIPQKHGKDLIANHPGKHIFHDLTGRGHNDISGRNSKELEDYITLFKEFYDSTL